MLDPIIDVLRVILEFFNEYVSNYGLAIIMLTILVKLVTLPLTLKQYKSMKAMQILQPKMKAIQEKYKNDKERLSQEMVKFYKDNKFNPLAGCLPLLLQMPILFALFQMLMSKDLAPILSKESFIWISSLTAKDPILVLLMVGTTFYQQLMVATDPQQKNMMLPMTAFLGFIAWNMPAGVLLYWVTTNALTIVQQLIQNTTSFKQKDEQETTSNKLQDSKNV